VTGLLTGLFKSDNKKVKVFQHPLSKRIFLSLPRLSKRIWNNMARKMLVRIIEKNTKK